MKLVQTLRLVALVAAFAVLSTGCKHDPKNITPIKNKAAIPPKGDGPSDLIPPSRGIGGDGVPTGIPTTGIETTNLKEFDGMIPDPSFFASETVYFDFDRSLVKSGDKKKVENVATYLKSHREEKVLVEGHCDERGTEEYNRTLGEKRAQAVREALAKLGVSSDRIRTKSFGEDKPAVNGHDEAAWSKNRRGEFVLLRPKAGT